MDCALGILATALEEIEKMSASVEICRLTPS